MPLLTLTLRGSELENPNGTIIKFERAYKFSKLKIQHIYHNIDSSHFASVKDQIQAVNLFMKMEGLVDSSRQIINYVGDYTTMKEVPTNKRYSSADKQFGQGTKKVYTASSTSYFDTFAQGVASERVEHSVDVNHLIPIGPSRHNDNGAVISRDLMKDIHDGEDLAFDGEFTLQLFYINHLGSVVPITNDTGGIQTSALKKLPVTFMTLVLEYVEKPFM